MKVWIDGEASSRGLISVSDYTFVRGDGCFEALRSYDGRVFAIGEHVARLEQSAALMEMPIPDHATVAGWIEDAGKSAGDGVVRVIATRGDPVRGTAGQVVVVAEPLPVVPAGLVLRTVAAPWHSAGRPWALAGAKTTSYAPNLSATRQAKSHGAHDALLVADDGTVLEGPTFSVGWISSGALETPDLDLLVLDSITRRHVLAAAADLGIAVRPGRFPLDRLSTADEVFAMSTIKEVTPVVEVDGKVFAKGPVAEQLKAAYRHRVEASLERQASH